MIACSVVVMKVVALLAYTRKGKREKGSLRSGNSMQGLSLSGRFNDGIRSWSRLIGSQLLLPIYFKP